MTDACILKDAMQLGPGGHACISPEGLKISTGPWSPSLEESSPAIFEGILGSLEHPKPARTHSLGLSGGLDSRLLLAVMQNWSPELKAHAFGPDHGPDVSIARKVARKVNLAHLEFRENPDEQLDHWTLFCLYARDPLLCERETTSLNLRHLT